MKQIAVYLFIILGLTSIGTSGCKDDAPLVPNYGSSHGELKYQITGLKDFEMERVDETKMQMNIEHLDGSKATEVQLGVSDLPVGLDVFFDVPKSAPSFISVATFVATRVKEGIYTIHITGTAMGVNLQSYPVTIRILPYTNESMGVKGHYTETRECSVDGTENHTVSIEAHRDVPNTVVIKGLWSGVHDNELLADLDPTTRSLQIAEQELMDITYKGSGTYTDNQILIDYYVDGPFGYTDTCRAILDRIQ